MANLSLRHIYKVYSNGCKAVNDFNMEIEDKEFIVFVGPSGCGKSTTLRMIAGLEEISAGELYIDDVLVNDMEPKDRDISMVFQNYALYPHMTVYDNMAFGLKLRHVPQEEIHKKVLWAAKVLKLTDYLDRKPRAMSGGQRQRVALGRAILRNPKVFLLDEPLSNLDAKLRTEMRAEITKLHQTLGTTFIYVTHDQVEAMTLGSRVVVMKLGYVQQIDTPQNLYNYPRNKFVAGFIGTPQMNFFEATLLRKGDKVEVKFEDCDAKFDVDFNNLIKVRPSYLKGDIKITVGLRCENISIEPEAIDKSKNVIKVKVSHFEELGSETLVYGDLNMNGDGFDENNTRVIIKARNKGSLQPGQIIDAAFDMSSAHFFDIESEDSIAPRVPVENVFDSEVKDNTLDLLGHKLILPPSIEFKDTKDVEIFIPTDAISFDGNIPAKVVNIEDVGKEKVIHLQIKDRIFFVVKDCGVNVGDKVNIKVDIKRVVVKKDNKVLIKDLKKRNALVGTYTNSQNNFKSVKNIENFYKEKAKKEIEELIHQKNIEVGKLGLNNILMKEYKKEFLKKKDDAQAEMSLQIGTLDLGKDGKKKVKDECKAKVDAAKKELAVRTEEFKQLKSSVTSSPELSQKAKEIKDLYQEKIDAINEDLALRVKEYENGKHKAIELFKSAEADDNLIFENALKELDESHNAELQVFADKINATNDKNEVEAIKNEVKLVNEKYNKAKDELISKSKTFFINIDGTYVKSNYVITKKIVQALGISIFNANYRYEIAIDSMKLAEDGLEATVFAFLDYGEEKFIVATAHNVNMIVRADKVYKKGEIVHIQYDINDIEVYENRLDIRLY